MNYRTFTNSSIINTFNNKELNDNISSSRIYKMCQNYIC